MGQVIGASALLPCTTSDDGKALHMQCLMLAGCCCICAMHTADAGPAFGVAMTGMQTGCGMQGWGTHPVDPPVRGLQRRRTGGSSRVGRCHEGRLPWEI
jgi:hypothetical protein